jgi:DNA-binding PadR family transcriptional regulator
MPRRSKWPDSLTPAALHILLALADEDRHGLGIVDEVAARTGGRVHLGPGVLYGTIRRLHLAKLIDESSPDSATDDRDPRRRYYHITEAGSAALRREVRHLDALLGVARAKAVLDR